LFQENTEEIRQIKKLEAQKEKIEELSTELEMMFNCTQDAMFMVEFEDEGFRYIRNNLAHQKLTSFNLTELKDKKPVELFGREIGEQIEANYRRCVEAGTSIIYEEVLILPTGKRTC
jgi:ferredoxin-like protein FixX